MFTKRHFISTLACRSSGGLSGSQSQWHTHARMSTPGTDPQPPPSPQHTHTQSLFSHSIRTASRTQTDTRYNPPMLQTTPTRPGPETPAHKTHTHTQTQWHSYAIHINGSQVSSTCSSSLPIQPTPMYCSAKLSTKLLFPCILCVLLVFLYVVLWLCIVLHCVH